MKSAQLKDGLGYKVEGEEAASDNSIVPFSK
jgi:hypothetical protein